MDLLLCNHINTIEHAIKLWVYCVMCYSLQKYSLKYRKYKGHEIISNTIYYKSKKYYFITEPRF